MIDEKEPRHNLAKHTPTPWQLKSEKDSFTISYDLYSDDGYVIVHSPGRMDGTDQANAEFIVRAVNNHQSLLEALKLFSTHRECEDSYYSCPKSADYCGGGYIECTCGADDALEAIRKAESNE